MKEKLLVCDLDGTLLDDNGEIDSFSLNEIKDFCERGGNFVICTGRLDQDIEYVEEHLGFKGSYRISQNGAVIKNRQGENLLIEEIPGDTIKELNRIFFNSQLRTEVSDYKNRYFPSPRAPEEVAEFIDTSIIVENLEDFVAHKINPLIYLTFGTHVDFESLEEQIKVSVGNKVTTVRTSSSSFEVFSNKVSKGNAVAYVMKQLEVEAGDVYVAGDAENDISMFSVTNNSFAVRKASNQVKRAANHYVVTVGELVRKYILGKEVEENE